MGRVGGAAGARAARAGRVLHMVRAGFTTAQIAQSEGIAERTARKIRAAVCQQEAVRLADEVLPNVALEVAAVRNRLNPVRAESVGDAATLSPEWRRLTELLVSLERPQESAPRVVEELVRRLPGFVDD